jgi:Dolichyl-phosphate-mannose-protein mannosyltransferase
MRSALVLACLAHVALFVVVVRGRLSYPFELEWMEGGMLAHVHRLVAGLPLYVKPSAEFVPYVYTPLFPALAAVLSHLFGPGFLAPRLVALLSTIVAFAVLGDLVARETRSRLAGVLAACLLLASYRVAGAFFDVGRADTLMLALLLVGAWLLRFGRGTPAAIASGLCLALAFLTKQSAVVVFAALLPYVGWHARGRLLLFLSAAVLPALLACVLLDRASGGWFRFYVFDVPRHHHLFLHVLLTFWTVDLLPHAGVAFLLVAAAALVAGPSRASARVAFHACLTLGLLLFSYSSRVHSGGWDNVLIPAFAAVALCAALAWWRLQQAASQSEDRRVRAFGPAVLDLAVVLQLGALLYDPGAQIPTRRDLDSGRTLIARIQSLPGDVMIPSSDYLARAAGKSGSAHYMAIWDVMRAGPTSAAAGLDLALEETARSARVTAIILPRPPDEKILGPKFTAAIREEFRESGTIMGPEELIPVTGVRSRPLVLFLRREPDGPR